METESVFLQDYWSMTVSTYSCGRYHIFPPLLRALPTSTSLVAYRQYNTMSFRLSPRLWNPKLGVRFSPKPKAKSLYPQLDVSRFVHGWSNDNHVFDSVERTGLAEGTRLDVVPPVMAVSSDQDSLGIEGDTPQTEDASAEAVANNIFPPSTLLRFQINPKLFYKALESPGGTPESFWSHAMYRAINDNGSARNVKVHYCRTKSTMEAVCKHYFMGNDVLGFDLEWVPWATVKSGPRMNVALIQLASEGHVGLFHVSLFPKNDFIAPSFKQIMEDPKVSKVGVSIKADCTRLKNFLDVDTRGIFELSHLYKVLKYSKEKRPDLINKKLVRLAVQTEEHLCLPLNKEDSVRSSDWSRPLDMKQIAYSASDAYAGFQLYHVMDEKRRQLDPCPPRPRHAELNLPLEFAMKPDDESSVEDEVVLMESLLDTRTPVPQAPALIPQKSFKVNAKARDSRVIAAELRLQSYQTLTVAAKGRKILVGPSKLRAYFIWHYNEALNPEAIAKLLRDPPLQTRTVISYIIESVLTEKLAYNRMRMRNELLIHGTLLHESISTLSTYQALAKECQITPNSERVDNT